MDGDDYSVGMFSDSSDSPPPISMFRDIPIFWSDGTFAITQVMYIPDKAPRSMAMRTLDLAKSQRPLDLTWKTHDAPRTRHLNRQFAYVKWVYLAASNAQQDAFSGFTNPPPLEKKFDGLTAQACYNRFQANMRAETGQVYVLTERQREAARREWARVLAEKQIAAYEAERNSVKVDREFEDWE